MSELRLHTYCDNFDKDVEKFELCTHCWMEWKMLQLLWEKGWQFLKKLNLELPYDPKIPLSGVYPKEFKMQVYTK